MADWATDNNNEQVVDNDGNYVYVGGLPDPEPPAILRRDHFHGLQKGKVSNEYQVSTNHDACVASAFPDTNYGSSAVLGPVSVDNAGSLPLVFVYIKATGLSNFTSGHTLDQGFLNLKRIFQAGFGIEPITRIQVNRVTSAWDESVITWNTRANEGGPDFFEFELRELTIEDQWAVIDIRDWLQNWIDGVWDNHGLVLKALFGDPIKKFHSSEAIVSNRPFFSLFYWPY